MGVRHAEHRRRLGARSPATSITANGGTLNFSGLPKEVYIAAAFDEKGDYDGTSGPPPTGTPITIYGEMGAAKAVPTGGADAAVTVTFDATVRMP